MCMCAGYKHRITSLIHCNGASSVNIFNCENFPFYATNVNLCRVLDWMHPSLHRYPHSRKEIAFYVMLVSYVQPTGVFMCNIFASTVSSLLPLSSLLHLSFLPPSSLLLPSSLLPLSSFPPFLTPFKSLSSVKNLRFYEVKIQVV